MEYMPLFFMSHADSRILYLDKDFSFSFLYPDCHSTSAICIFYCVLNKNLNSKLHLDFVDCDKRNSRRDINRKSEVFFLDLLAVFLYRFFYNFSKGYSFRLHISIAFKLAELT